MDEALAQALVAGTPHVVLLVDPAGQVVSANQAARRLFGDLVGQAWLEQLDLFSRDKGRQLLAVSWAAGSAHAWELDHLTGNDIVLLRLDTFVLKEWNLLAFVGEDQTATLELTGRLAATNQQLEGTLLALERCP